MCGLNWTNTTRGRSKRSSEDEQPSANKVLYKVAFHGGFNNIWSSLMTIPEARSITRCIKKHDQCVAKQIVAEEAEVRGKGRYIINPEMMEAGDSSDGSQQFDQS